MTNFSTLQAKVNDLKAKITVNSITPIYLGAILDDFISIIQQFDLVNATVSRNQTTLYIRLQVANESITVALPSASASYAGVLSVADYNKLADAYKTANGAAEGLETTDLRVNDLITDINRINVQIKAITAKLDSAPAVYSKTESDKIHKDLDNALKQTTTDLQGFIGAVPGTYASKSELADSLPWRGSLDAYNRLASHSPNRFYAITTSAGDISSLYLGSTRVI